MALPTSGQLSVGAIKTELAVPNDPFTLQNAENGTYTPINVNSTYKPDGALPNTITEWYGYDHTQGGGGSSSTLQFYLSSTNLTTFNG
jgi:hypothetical protein